MDGTNGTNGENGMDGEDGDPGPIALGFSYVAYDLRFVADVPLVGTLPIPFNEVAVLQEDGTTATDDADGYGTVSHGQCAPITSRRSPDRYRAFGGDAIDYTIGVEDDTLGTQAFKVDPDDKDGNVFTGYPNVVAGDYMYVLSAMSEGVTTQSRKWMLNVSARDLPAESDNTTDTRNTGLLGTATEDEAGNNEENAAVANDWADFVPPDFKTTTTDADGVEQPNTASAIMNVPRLNLLGDNADTIASATLDGVINSFGDVDVYWLGSLAPNWKLEVTVEGTSTIAATGERGDHNEVMVQLYNHTDDVEVMMMTGADPSYNHQIGGLEGGLECDDYYVKVSGDEGTYQLVWKLTNPAPPAE
jgi:hypothetical protein